jgi:hypothetical protein
VVAEQHRHVTGPIVITRPESAEKRVRVADGLVTVLAMRPSAVAVAQQHAIGEIGIERTGFDLCAKREG